MGQYNGLDWAWYWCIGSSRKLGKGSNEMMAELLRILIPVLLLGFSKALFDYHQIGKGLGINHTVEWCIWASFFVLIDWLFELNLWVLPLQACLSWLWFDAVLNRLRGIHIFKVGETWVGDIWLRKLPSHEISTLILKTVLIIITALLYHYAK